MATAISVFVRSFVARTSGERHRSNGARTTGKQHGKEGIGSARDAVLYTVVVRYPRMFAMSGLMPLSKIVQLEASTVLRNQPFDEQDRTEIIRDCPRP